MIHKSSMTEVLNIVNNKVEDCLPVGYTYIVFSHLLKTTFLEL